MKASKNKRFFVALLTSLMLFTNVGNFATTSFADVDEDTSSLTYSYVGEEGTEEKEEERETEEERDLKKLFSTQKDIWSMTTKELEEYENEQEKLDHEFRMKYDPEYRKEVKELEEYKKTLPEYKKHLASITENRLKNASKEYIKEAKKTGIVGTSSWGWTNFGPHDTTGRVPCRATLGDSGQVPDTIQDRIMAQRRQYEEYVEKYSKDSKYSKNAKYDHGIVYRPMLNQFTKDVLDLEGSNVNIEMEKGYKLGSSDHIESKDTYLTILGPDNILHGSKEDAVKYVKWTFSIPKLGKQTLDKINNNYDEGIKPWDSGNYSLLAATSKQHTPLMNTIYTEAPIPQNINGKSLKQIMDESNKRNLITYYSDRLIKNKNSLVNNMYMNRTVQGIVLPTYKADYARVDIYGFNQNRTYTLPDMSYMDEIYKMANPDIKGAGAKVNEFMNKVNLNSESYGKKYVISANVTNEFKTISNSKNYVKIADPKSGNIYDIKPFTRVWKSGKKTTYWILPDGMSIIKLQDGKATLVQKDYFVSTPYRIIGYDKVTGRIYADSTAAFYYRDRELSYDKKSLPFKIDISTSFIIEELKSASPYLEFGMLLVGNYIKNNNAIPDWSISENDFTKPWGRIRSNKTSGYEQFRKEFTDPLA